MRRETMHYHALLHNSNYWSKWNCSRIFVSWNENFFCFMHIPGHFTIPSLDEKKKFEFIGTTIAPELSESFNRLKKNLRQQVLHIRSITILEPINNSFFADPCHYPRFSNIWQHALLTIVVAHHPYSRKTGFTPPFETWTVRFPHLVSVIY